MPVSAVSLLLVMWLWHADRERTSPGELSAVHAQDPRLVGPESCERCHGATAADLTQSCLACHEAIGTQLTSAHGLHGQLPVDSAHRCESCHQEHHGREFRLVDRRAFTLAGIAEPAKFDHAGLDFGLTGRHVTAACDKCHLNAALDPLPIGQTRFLGLKNDCRSCHNDVHRGIYGADCASCHGQEHAFRTVAGFSHTDLFPLVGVHAEAKCTACHTADVTRNLAVRIAQGQTPRHPPDKVRSCSDCHASPHRQDFLQRVSTAIGRAASQSCEHCHAADARSFRGRDARMDVALHALTGFRLDAPHGKAECSSCHPGFAAQKATAESFRRCYPGRAADDCATCHGNPHRGDFVAEGLQHHTCVHCHSGTSFRPATLTADRHAETGFPLSAAHQRVACAQCHPQQATASNAARHAIAVRHFAGTATTCRACHSDPHRNEFASSAFREQDCSGCHDDNSFRPPRFTIAQHASTGFPLSTAHQRVACAKCHPQTVSVRAATGPAITVHKFSGAPTSCRECHADPHLGQFADGAFRQQDCTACHQENSFARVEFGIAEHDHTRFPLTGAHAAVACRSCHTEVVTASLDNGQPVQARVFHGTPTDCRGCHADIHRGAFDNPELPTEVAGRTDCARCHTTERFDVLVDGTFDHWLWTGYPLAGAHTDVKCAQCHPRTREPNAEGRTLARVAGRDCQSCHQDPHLGQFGGPEQVDCARCHNVSEGFRNLSFDHQTDARFKLDKTHARLECAKCHRSYDLPNGGRVVRYKPLGTTCGDCHSAGASRSRAARPSSAPRGGTP